MEPLKAQKRPLNDSTPGGLKKTKFEENRSETPTSSSSETPAASQIKSKKARFIYGNYDRYYGYRPTAENDCRIGLFKEHSELFVGKCILDIGCHTGMVTLQVAKHLSPKHIDGVDIDKALIQNARRLLVSEVKATGHLLPVTYHVGNYVLQSDVLLGAETEKYDTILCLSVTKWIQLNFGDDGLKRAFKRMYSQLRPGGHLILEPQPFEGYSRRKKLTPQISQNFWNIKLFPKLFTDYLLSQEVGFKSVRLISNPKSEKGFSRPIQVFEK